ncbi:helix-turn-helix domain-containing protein [Paenibacillus antri]|nr:helix-turn-helix domain-containing protein [Paenibacillus antri]
MSFNVLIVDDEPMARAGLLSMYDWDRNGFRVVGEASDGRKALQLMEEIDAHIVITDIAMPVMDGLEFARISKERFPRTKIVLLSCHNEFDYARQAMRIGVSEYLLKVRLESPLLERTLVSLREQLVAETRAGKEQALTKALERITPWESQPFAADAPAYSVAVLLFEPADCNGEADNALESARNRFYACFPEGHAARHGKDQLVCYIPESSGGRPIELPFADIQRALSERDVPLSIGLSLLQSSTAPEASFLAAYAQALEAAERRFFVGPNQIVSYSSKRSVGGRDGQRFFETMHCLKKFLSDGFMEKAHEQLVKVAGDWGSHWRRADVVDEAKQLVRLFQGEPAPLGEIDAWLDDCPDLSTLKMRVFERFDALRGRIDGGERDRTGWVQKAILYIHERYSEDLCLADVANHVSLSRNYFSDQFRRHTGLTFIDYVTMTRMAKAKELLREGRLRVYEIAERCGFNDVKHFSKQFRKYTGKPPSEYSGR